MSRSADRLLTLPAALRVALAAFVVVWLFGPRELRSAVPLWLVFLVAVGLELHLFVGALRRAPSPRRDAGPQRVDLERYGYAAAGDELLLVRRGGRELWIPYAGERGEELEALIAQAEEEAGGEDAEELAPVPEQRGLWPAARRLAVTLAVVGAVGLAVWLIDTGTGWDALAADTRAAAAARFSEEASRIAGKGVTVRCDESGEHVGIVQHADGAAVVGGWLAYLTPERCLDLYRLAFEAEVTFSRTARAIAVLAHEAWHLRGVADEGTTECYALQSGVELGQRLGLEEGMARQMMRQQLAENLGRGAGTLEYVVSPDCRDGGRLDLRPDDPRFP